MLHGSLRTVSYARRPRRGRGRPRRRGGTSWTTGPEGRFSLVDVDAGTVIVRATMATYEPAKRELEDLRALAHVGRFDDALEAADRAYRAAREHGRRDLADEIDRHRRRYRAGRSLVQPAVPR